VTTDRLAPASQLGASFPHKLGPHLARFEVLHEHFGPDEPFDFRVGPPRLRFTVTQQLASRHGIRSDLLRNTCHYGVATVGRGDREVAALDLLPSQIVPQVETDPGTEGLDGEFGGLFINGLRRNLRDVSAEPRTHHVDCANLVERDRPRLCQASDRVEQELWVNLLTPGESLDRRVRNVSVNPSILRIRVDRQAHIPKAGVSETSGYTLVFGLREKQFEKALGPMGKSDSATLALSRRTRRPEGAVETDVISHSRPPGLSEDTVPERGRWWPEASKEYAGKRRLEGRWNTDTTRAAVRCLGAWPARFAVAGLPAPVHARDVTAETVLAWKDDPVGPGRHGERRPMKQPSAFQALWMLRGFLGWAGNPVAGLERLWHGQRGDATNRRWFDGATLDHMFGAASSDRLRLVLAALGWAGLRRNELWLLKVGDVNLSMDRPAIVVTRKGGRRQELPVARTVANALRPFVVARPSDARVYPGCYQLIYDDVGTMGEPLGLKVAPHDLQRTYGRILYYEMRVDVNELRSLYGHATTEQTLYYIGAVSDKMRAAVERFDRPRPTLALAVPGGP
jgi:integrase